MVKGPNGGAAAEAAGDDAGPHPWSLWVQLRQDQKVEQERYAGYIQETVEHAHDEKSCLVAVQSRRSAGAPRTRGAPERSLRRGCAEVTRPRRGPWLTIRPGWASETRLPFVFPCPDPVTAPVPDDGADSQALALAPPVPASTIWQEPAAWVLRRELGPPGACQVQGRVAEGWP